MDVQVTSQALYNFNEAIYYNLHIYLKEKSFHFVYKTLCPNVPYPALLYVQDCAARHCAVVCCTARSKECTHSHTAQERVCVYARSCMQLCSHYVLLHCSKTGYELIMINIRKAKVVSFRRVFFVK